MEVQASYNKAPAQMKPRPNSTSMHASSASYEAFVNVDMIMDLKLISWLNPGRLVPTGSGLRRRPWRHARSGTVASRRHAGVVTDIKSHICLHCKWMGKRCGATFS